MITRSSTQNVASDEHSAVDATLRRFLGYRLKRAYNIIRSDLLERLEPMGLRITTFSTLVLINDTPGMRQSELAVALEIKRSNMVAIVDDLENRGWVDRREFPNDRRAFALFPTKAGKKAFNKAVGIVTEHDAQVLECLTAKELVTLSELLEKIESTADKSNGL